MKSCRSADRFWQDVYIAAIKAGISDAVAREIADRARAAFLNL